MQSAGRTSALLDDASSDASTSRPEAAQVWTGGWPQTPREFEVLLDRLLDRLVWYAFRRLRDLGEAEDAVQDVLVRAYADRSKRMDVVRVVPYLYRMVANACAERYRRSGTRPLSIDSIDIEDLPDEKNRVSEQIAAVEQLEWIEQLLSRLPARQAEVVRLRVLDELPLAELAEIVGCSLPTAKSRLYYGLQKLRRMVPRPEEDKR